MVPVPAIRSGLDVCGQSTLTGLTADSSTARSVRNFRRLWGSQVTGTSTHVDPVQVFNHPNRVIMSSGDRVLEEVPVLPGFRWRSPD